jgi:hypothetical protein
VVAIKRAVQESLDHVPDEVENPYGDGHAGERIAEAILTLKHAGKYASVL